MKRRSFFHGYGCRGDAGQTRRQWSRAPRQGDNGGGRSRGQLTGGGQGDRGRVQEVRGHRGGRVRMVP